MERRIEHIFCREVEVKHTRPGHLKPNLVQAMWVAPDPGSVPTDLAQAEPAGETHLRQWRGPEAEEVGRGPPRQAQGNDIGQGWFGNFVWLDLREEEKELWIEANVQKWSMTLNIIYFTNEIKILIQTRPIYKFKSSKMSSAE